MTTSPSTRIENATVWMGHRVPDGRVETTDALLMRDGRVVALGAAARAMDADEVVDARGGFVAPAFGDGHVHPIFGGLEQQFAAVREGTSAGAGSNRRPSESQYESARVRADDPPKWQAERCPERSFGSPSGRGTSRSESVLVTA